MKNILILSCKAGEGHNAAAKALQERFEHEGHRAQVHDFFALTSEKKSEGINTFYVTLAKYAPPLFGIGYHICVWCSPLFRSFLRSPAYLMCAAAAPKLLELLQKEKFDAVVVPHIFPVLALTHLKRKGYDVPLTIYVSTDYTCYPFVEEAPHCDYFICAHEAIIPAFTKRGIPAEKVRAYGIPVSMRFTSLPTRLVARAALGLSPTRNVYLIMGGSMGAGHIRTFVEKLHSSAKNAELVVICGKNDKLRLALEKEFGSCQNVHIIGFTTEVPTYMAACDVLYTKPGGLTSTEALVSKTPLVHTAPIPGCESFNFRFFRDHGISLPAKKQKQQIQNGKLLAENPQRREEMRNAQSRCAKPNAALDILRLIEKHTKD